MSMTAWGIQINGLYTSFHVLTTSFVNFIIFESSTPHLFVQYFQLEQSSKGRYHQHILKFDVLLLLLQHTR